MNRRDLLKISGTAFAGLFFTTKINAMKSSAEAVSFLDSTTDKEPSLLLLNFNENSIGLSPNAVKAIKNQLDNAFRYPDQQATNLIKFLAKEHKVDKSQVLLGPGSSDIIRATVHASYFKAVKKQRKIQLIMPSPTFGLAEEYATPLGVEVKNIPLTKDFFMDIEAMRKAAEDFDGISLCYLCNPNNPTSTLTPSLNIKNWVESANTDNTIFLIDEAYSEYINEPTFTSGLELLYKGNVIVTKTFSKIFALAGLRVGYGISSPELAKEISAFISIDNMNLAGLVAAQASLEDRAFITKSLEITAQSKKMVEEALTDLNIKYLPSQTNFIFHEVKGDPVLYKKRMEQNYIIVGRPFPPLEQWNRLTLGRPDEMKRFIKALYKFRENNWI